jgi:hypothetical protein
MPSSITEGLSGRKSTPFSDIRELGGGTRGLGQVRNERVLAIVGTGQIDATVSPDRLARGPRQHQVRGEDLSDHAVVDSHHGILDLVERLVLLGRRLPDGAVFPRVVGGDGEEAQVVEQSRDEHLVGVGISSRRHVLQDEIGELGHGRVVLPEAAPPPRGSRFLPVFSMETHSALPTAGLMCAISIRQEAFQ